MLLDQKFTALRDLHLLADPGSFLIPNTGLALLVRVVNVLGIDGLDDGALDVLEIKSVAPFVRASGNRTMELYDRGPHDNLAPWIVPHRA